MSTVRICRIPTNDIEPITEHRIDQGLAASQREVGGLIELIRVTSYLDLYINEEGLLHGFDHNPRASSLAGPGSYLVGPAFLVGHRPGSPNTSDVPEGTADFLNVVFRRRVAG